MRSVALLLVLAGCQFPRVELQSPSADARGDSSADSRGDATSMGDATGDAVGDATDAVSCDPATCVPAGGTCTNSGCGITAPDDQAVACPPMTTCNVTCPTDNHSCGTGLTCSVGSTCTYYCDADHTCDTGALDCGPGTTCEIYCKGNHACDGLMITCSANATCTTHCCGDNACTGAYGCSGVGTCVTGAAVCP